MRLPNRLWPILVLAAAAAPPGGCSSTDRSSPPAASPPTVAPAHDEVVRPVGAPAAAAASPTMSAADAAAFLSRVGRAARAAHPELVDGAAGVADDELSADGACARPDAAARAALRRRIGAWIERRTRAAGDRAPRGTDEDGEPLDRLRLRFGCVEPAGVVVEASTRRTSRAAGADHEGDRTYDWILRAGSGLRVLASVDGTPQEYGEEWARITSLEVLALHDLDGDGARDVLFAEHFFEGGTLFARDRLVLTTAAGRTRELAAGHNGIVLRRHDGDAIVVELGLDQTDVDHSLLRCVLPPGVIERCPAVDGVVRDERIARAIELFADLEADGVRRLSRGTVATLLDALAVPPDQAGPVLGAFDRGDPGMVVDEVEQAAMDEYEGYRAPTCAAPEPAATARVRHQLRRWLAAHERSTLTALGICTTDCALRGPAHVDEIEVCGSSAGAFAVARWTDPVRAEGQVALRREGLFWVADAGPTLLEQAAAWEVQGEGDASTPPEIDDSPLPLALDVEVVLGDGAPVAVVVDDIGHQVRSYVDGGRPRATADAPDSAMTIELAGVAVVRVGGPHFAATSYLRVGRGALEPVAVPAFDLGTAVPAGPPLVAAIVAGEQFHLGLETLLDFDADQLGDAAYRERVRAALVRLGASAIDVDEVVGGPADEPPTATAPPRPPASPPSPR